MNKEECKKQLKELQEIISPYQSQINTIKSRLEMLEYNEFRADVQNEIEILQKQLPHLGKFYFDDLYDDYDNYTLYYIYYQNESNESDKVYFNESFGRTYNKHKFKDHILVKREPYDVYKRRIFGKEVD